MFTVLDALKQMAGVCREFNMYGDSAAEATMIDQLIEGIKDFGGRCPGEFFLTRAVPAQPPP